MKTREEIEKAADQKQKEFVDEYGMLGFLFNPYEPFDIVLVDMYTENKTPWCNVCDRPVEYCRCEK